MILCLFYQRNLSLDSNNILLNMHSYGKLISYLSSVCCVYGTISLFKSIRLRSNLKLRDRYEPYYNYRVQLKLNRRRSSCRRAPAVRKRYVIKESPPYAVSPNFTLLATRSLLKRFRFDRLIFLFT